MYCGLNYSLTFKILSFETQWKILKVSEYGNIDLIELSSKQLRRISTSIKKDLKKVFVAGENLITELI